MRAPINNVEPVIGFEPMASSLPRKCSTPELHRRNGGRAWIRTKVGENQRVYSPSPLATRAHAHFAKKRKPLYNAFKLRATRILRNIFLQSSAQRSNNIPGLVTLVNGFSSKTRARAYPLRIFIILSSRGRQQESRYRQRLNSVSMVPAEGFCGALRAHSLRGLAAARATTLP